MINDQYDLFCFQRLGQAVRNAFSINEADDVTCACAKYLRKEGYRISPYFSSTRTTAQATQLIPTTTTHKLGA